MVQVLKLDSFWYPSILRPKNWPKRSREYCQKVHYSFNRIWKKKFQKKRYFYFSSMGNRSHFRSLSYVLLSWVSKSKVALNNKDHQILSIFFLKMWKIKQNIIIKEKFIKYIHKKMDNWLKSESKNCFKIHSFLGKSRKICVSIEKIQ